MPLVIPAGYAECAFIHTHNQTRAKAVCTLGVNTADPVKLSTVGNKWGLRMLAEMNAIWTYTGFSARVAGGTIVTDTYSVAAAGGGTGVSPQVSYLYKKSTALPGRKGRGRFYYPGCDEASVDDAGKVTAGKIGGLQAQYNLFVADLAAISGGVAGYLLHNDATAPSAFTSVVPEAYVATQRRRLRR